MTLPRSSWGTLLLAYKLVLGSGRPVFVRLMKWPFLALLGSIVLQLIVSASAEPVAPGVMIVQPGLQGAVLLVQLAAVLLTVPGFTAWIRWLVDPKAPVVFHWRRAEWLFLGRAIQIWFLAILAALPAGAIVLFGLSLVAAPPVADTQAFLATFAALGSAGLLPVLISGAVMAFVVSRYSLSIIAAALGLPSDLRIAGNASRPARWHMFWTLVLYLPTSVAAMVPIMLAGFVIAILVATAASSAVMASVWGNLITTILFLPVSLALYGILAAVFCLYYRWLVVGDGSD